MIKLKPPTHTIDGLAVFVSSTDPAWDLPRIEAERDAQVARALAEKQDAYTYPAARAGEAVLRPARLQRRHVDWRSPRAHQRPSSPTRTTARTP